MQVPAHCFSFPTPYAACRLWTHASTAAGSPGCSSQPCMHSGARSGQRLLTGRKASLNGLLTALPWWPLLQLWALGNCFSPPLWHQLTLPQSRHACFLWCCSLKLENTHRCMYSASRLSQVQHLPQATGWCHLATLSAMSHMMGIGIAAAVASPGDKWCAEYYNQRAIVRCRWSPPLWRCWLLRRRCSRTGSCQS